MNEPLPLGTLVEMQWVSITCRIGRIVKVYLSSSGLDLWPGQWTYRVEFDPYFCWDGPQFLNGQNQFEIQLSNWFYETVPKVELL